MNKINGRIAAKEAFKFVLDKLFVKVDVEDRGGNYITSELVLKDELKNRPIW
jgi:hypothetical protein